MLKILVLLCLVFTGCSRDDNALLVYTEEAMRYQQLESRAYELADKLRDTNRRVEELERRIPKKKIKRTIIVEEGSMQDQIIKNMNPIPCGECNGK